MCCPTLVDNDALHLAAIRRADPDADLGEALVPAIRKPNVLVLIPDQQCPFLGSPFAHPFAQIPVMQRLADRGVVFDNANGPSPWWPVP